MNKPYFDDETVMAFADGETDAETTAQIEQALEVDDDLVARVAQFMETSVASKEAMRPLLDEPVPASLEQSVRRMVKAHADAMEQSAKSALPPEPIETGNIVPLRRKAAAPPLSRRLMPLAASITLAIFAAGSGYLAGVHNGPAGENPLLLPQAVSAVLDTAASAAEPVSVAGGSLLIKATFRNHLGELCREFEAIRANEGTLVSVACHGAEGWETRLAVSEPIDGAGYQPAGASETLDAYLQSIGATQPLATDKEQSELQGLQKLSGPNQK
jgi:hypothetical protein